MTVLRIRIGLVSVLVILLAWLGYQRYADYRARVRGQEAQQAALQQMRAFRAQAQLARAEQKNKFTDWAAVQLMPRAYPKPPSAWLVGEKAFYCKLLDILTPTSWSPHCRSTSGGSIVARAPP